MRTGELRVRLVVDGDGTRRLYIDQADPVIRASKQIIDYARTGDAPWTSMDGDLLRIKAENRTVIYRIGEYLPEIGCYAAEWPD
jgi:hypothetical protein